MEYYFLVGLLGLVVGSFLNVIIVRLPVMLLSNWKAECRIALLPEGTVSSDPQGRFNLAWPRSQCPHCSTPIQWLDNFPVLSFCFLLARCRACKTPISWRYPLVELSTSLLSLTIFHKWGLTPFAAYAALLSASLLVLSCIDLEHLLLPDDITLPLLWLGLIINQHESLFTDGPSALWGAVSGYLTLWGIFWVFKAATGKDGMGYGDFKLLAVLGAWFGWQALPFILLSSSIMGSVIGIVWVGFLKHPRHDPIPFGPFLALAGWIYLYWQPQWFAGLTL